MKCLHILDYLSFKPSRKMLTQQQVLKDNDHWLLCQKSQLSLNTNQPQLVFSAMVFFTKTNELQSLGRKRFLRIILIMKFISKEVVEITFEAQTNPLDLPQWLKSLFQQKINILGVTSAYYLSFLNLQTYFDAYCTRATITRS